MEPSLTLSALERLEPKSDVDGLALDRLLLRELFKRPLCPNSITFHPARASQPFRLNLKPGPSPASTAATKTSFPKISQTVSRILEGFIRGEHCQAGQLLETALHRPGGDVLESAREAGQDGHSSGITQEDFSLIPDGPRLSSLAPMPRALLLKLKET